MPEFQIEKLSICANLTRSDAKAPDFLTPAATDGAHRIHRALPDASPTPLVRLDALAGQLGVRAIWVKDESKRFGLNAFKGLGGLYALTCVICRALGRDVRATTFDDLHRPAYAATVRRMVFVTATDGNHGKGIAWAAGQLGCRAVVYLPTGSAPQRVQAIRDVNPRATAAVLPMGYDDAVRYAARQAAANGWCFVQDTGWPGYEEIPAWIMQGYTTMAEEARQGLAAAHQRPTHVLVQAGVGAMAGSVIGYLAHVYGARRPRMIVVEPEAAACVYESVRAADGTPHAAAAMRPTVMAGLNCGEVCSVAWPILRDFADWCIKCPDEVAIRGMRRLAWPTGGDPAVVSGESGAVTAGLLDLLAQPTYREARQMLGLDAQSVVLCFSTEGDTDPAFYREVMQNAPISAERHRAK